MRDAILTISGIAVVGSVLFYESLASGQDSIDRFAIRGRVAKGALANALGFFKYGIPPVRSGRAMMAMIWDESRGNPDHYLGDVGNSNAGGASVGCAQIAFKTAKRYGLIPSDMDLQTYIDTYQFDEGWGIASAFKILLFKLQEDNGNFEYAVEDYNGSLAYLYDIENLESQFYDRTV